MYAELVILTLSVLLFLYLIVILVKQNTSSPEIKIIKINSTVVATPTGPALGVDNRTLDGRTKPPRDSSSESSRYSSRPLRPSSRPLRPSSRPLRWWVLEDAPTGVNLSRTTSSPVEIEAPYPPPSSGMWLGNFIRGGYLETVVYRVKLTSKGIEGTDLGGNYFQIQDSSVDSKPKVFYYDNFVVKFGWPSLTFTLVRGFAFLQLQVPDRSRLTVCVINSKLWLSGAELDSDQLLPYEREILIGIFPRDLEKYVNFVTLHSKIKVDSMEVDYLEEKSQLKLDWQTRGPSPLLILLPQRVALQGDLTLTGHRVEDYVLVRGKSYTLNLPQVDTPETVEEAQPSSDYLKTIMSPDLRYDATQGHLVYKDKHEPQQFATWLNTISGSEVDLNSSPLRNRISLLLRDLIGASYNDPYFPRWRYLDLYEMKSSAPEIRLHLLARRLKSENLERLAKLYLGIQDYAK